MQHVRDQLLERIRAAFAQHAALFDSDANAAQASPTRPTPHAHTSSVGGSPPHTTPTQPAGPSPSHSLPAADDASLYDSLPPLVDDLPGSTPASVPARPPRTSLGDGVCMDAPSTALSEGEIDILAPSPLPPGVTVEIVTVEIISCIVFNCLGEYTHEHALSYIMVSLLHHVAPAASSHPFHAARPAALLTDSLQLDHKDSNKVADAALDCSAPMTDTLPQRQSAAGSSGLHGQVTQGCI